MGRSHRCGAAICPGILVRCSFRPGLMPASGFTDEFPDPFQGGGIPRSKATKELRAGGSNKVGMGVDRPSVLPAGRFAGLVSVAFQVERKVQGLDP